MKKERLIILVLLLGGSFKLYASTGNANDGLEFTLVIVGLLLIILGFIYGVNYLQKNGKTIVYNAMSFFKKMIVLLRVYFNKVKSN